MLAFAIICAIFDYFDFSSNFELSYFTNRHVSAKLRRPKSFLMKLSFWHQVFLLDQRSRLTHFLKKYIDVFASYAPVSKLRKLAHRVDNKS